jgi:hypothetical protein
MGDIFKIGGWKGQFDPIYAIKACGGMEAYLHTFLIGTR